MTTPAVRVKNAKASVGCPRSSFQIQYHDFANLVATKNHYVASPKFTCYGHQWELRVFPGGDNQAEEGKLSVFLYNLSKATITVRFGVDIFDKFGKTKKAAKFVKRVFSDNSRSWGWDIISRSDILDESQNILDDEGTLTVVVSVEEEPTNNVFAPKNPLLKMMQAMFNDQNTADVCFEVSTAGEKEDDDGKNKRVKTTTPFYAHHNILRGCAPILLQSVGQTIAVEL